VAYISPRSRGVGAGDLIDHPKMIALNYLKNDFIIDFFIALPLPQVHFFPSLHVVVKTQMFSKA